MTSWRGSEIVHFRPAIPENSGLWMNRLITARRSPDEIHADHPLGIEASFLAVL